MSNKAEIKLSPYVEICCGSVSIYDHVDVNFKVDDQVITYLKLGHTSIVCLEFINIHLNQGRLL